MRAGGKKAYDLLLSTLQKGDFQEFGLSYLLSMYAEFKDCIARYLRLIAETSTTLAGLAGSINRYKRVAEKFQRVTELIPFKGAAEPEKAHPYAKDLIDREKIPEVIELISDCSRLEAEAMTVIEAVLS